MAYKVQDNCTLVIKSLKEKEVPIVQQQVFGRTTGLVEKHPLNLRVIDDLMPEFPGAKIMYANYLSTQCAANAAKIMMDECKCNRWGGGYSRATTKDRLRQTVKTSDFSFPLYVSGFAHGVQQELQRDLQHLYSSKYGACFVKVQLDHNRDQYAFINFSDFKAALKALRDSDGIVFGQAVLKPKLAPDTDWTIHVWSALEQTRKLSFEQLQSMAKERVESTLTFSPTNFLRPLQNVPQFHVDMDAQQLSWATPDKPSPAWLPSVDLRNPEADATDFACLSEAPSSDLKVWGCTVPKFSRRGFLNEQSRSSEQSRLADCEPKDDDGRPFRFVCPISLELMADPVQLSNGKIYERAEIETYLQSGEARCPLTQVPIDPSCLTPLPQLRAEIAEFQRSFCAECAEAQGAQQEAAEERHEAGEDAAVTAAKGKKEGVPEVELPAASEQQDAGSRAQNMEASCAKVERTLLGEEMSGYVKQRIERLEVEVYGAVQVGGLKGRLQALEREL